MAVTEMSRKTLCRTVLGILIPCLILSCAALKNRRDADISTIDQQMVNIRQEIDRLYRKLAEMVGRLKTHDRMISDLEADLDAEPDGPAAQMGADAETVETPAEVDVARISEIYAQALLAYRQKDHETALQGFETVLTTAPNSDLADNAAYWAGECRYAQNAYPDALARFQDVLFRFPDGNKTPDALLKTGYCRLAMGERAEARRILEEVVRAYPAHHAAQSARKKLNSLG